MNKKTWISNSMYVVVAVLFFALLPVLSLPVHGGDGLDIVVHGLNAAGDAEAGKKVYVTMEELDSKISNFSSLYANKKVTVQWEVGPNALGKYRYETPELKDGMFSFKPEDSDKGMYLRFYTLQIDADTYYNRNTAQIRIPGSTLGISLDNKTGIMRVTGVTNLEGRSFNKLFFDNKLVCSDLLGKSFSRNIDTKKYNIGHSSLSATLDNGDEVKYPYKIPVFIYEKPSIKASQFKTYNNSFVFTAGAVSSKYDGICLSFRPKGGKKWTMSDPTKASGYCHSNASGRFTGLKANTVYEVRAFYTKNADGSNYSLPYYGVDSTYSNTVTIKTGPSAKPPVKSIKITKAKYKKARTKGKWYWDAGSLKYLKPRTFYQTIITVKVTMKKKPGVKGIYIGDRKVKGNKKTYKARFTLEGKMKGKKVTVDVRTYGNDSYGQFSPICRKKVKVKK